MNNLFEFNNKAGTKKMVVAVDRIIGIVLNEPCDPNMHSVCIVYDDNALPKTQYLTGYDYDEIRVRLGTIGGFIEVKGETDSMGITHTGTVFVNKSHILSVESTDDPYVTLIYLQGLHQLTVNQSYDSIIENMISRT